MHGTSRRELAAELERTARLCEDTAQRYVDEHRGDGSADVVSGLLLAAAALETAVRAVEDDEAEPTRQTALMITGTLARDAADAVERRGLDERVVRCVAALRRVVELCDAAAS